MLLLNRYYFFLDMKAEFREHLADLICFLLSAGAGVPPKTVGGSPVLASDFANYVESYVHLLNTNKDLSSQSIFQVCIELNQNLKPF